MQVMFGMNWEETHPLKFPGCFCRGTLDVLATPVAFQNEV